MCNCAYDIDDDDDGAEDRQKRVVYRPSYYLGPTIEKKKNRQPTARSTHRILL